MKKLLRKVWIIVLAAVLCIATTGCSLLQKSPITDVVTFEKLSTPKISVDADGIASWGKVAYAMYYAYIINDGEEKLTDERSVRLADGQTVKVKAVSGSDDFVDSDYSQPITYNRSDFATKLATPSVAVSASGLATWAAVDNAQYYVYTVNGGAEVMTQDRSVLLTDNQTLVIKAGSADVGYIDSDYSNPVTYRANATPIKLAAPVVYVDEYGNATWAAVDHSQGYVYIINNGAETATSERGVTLSDKDAVKVKAKGDGNNYTDSDYSLPVTYDKPAVDHTDHVDSNSDGVCDVCKKSVTAELSFFAINDLHGKYMDTDTQPGVDELTTYIKNLYADNTREEVLLSSGDMWQGTVESSTNKGALMTEWMNDVGFVSMTLGNHEYDWGAAVLKPNSELADFPFLAINVKYNGKAVDYCQGSTVVEKGGIKIGIIGAIGDCLSSISGDFTAGLSFATGSELTALVKAESDKLRKSEGCDFIVYSIHEGYESSLSGTTSVTSGEISYYDTSLSDGYVDLVFEGHTHQSYILQDEHGVYHLQGGGENRYMSGADVSYNTVTGQYVVSPRLISSGVYGNSAIKDDPIVNTIYKKYFPDGDPYTTVLGGNSSKKYSGEICDRVAQLYYEKGVAEWGKQYEIVLGGGFLRLRSPYNVSASNVTYADLFSILPFDNDIVLGRISGQYLKWKFLETTNTDYHIYGTINADDVSNTKNYYIIVDSYTSSYAPNRITEVARLTNGKYARDLLADYVAAGGWGTAGARAAFNSARSLIQNDLTRCA